MPAELPPDESLKEDRKKASQVGLFLGGVAFVVGALICLIYLLVAQPWKLQWIYKR